MYANLGDGSVGLSGSTFLTPVVQNRWVGLASTGGLFAVSVFALSMQTSTLGKVVFGVSTTIFGILLLERVIRLAT